MSRYLRYAMVMFIAMMGVIGSAGAGMAAPQPGTSGDVSMAQGATGTVSASIYICDGQEDVVWGGTPDANCYASTASLVMYLIGDGTDDSWTVGSGGSATVPAGTYEVYENVYWTMANVTVTEGATTYVTVLLPGEPLPPPPPPQPVMATVSASIYICDGLDHVSWGGTPDANCDLAYGSLVFYLIGDGTDDYWAIASGGSASIPVGSYEVYDNITWSMATVNVTASGACACCFREPSSPPPKHSSHIPPPPPPPPP